MTRCMCGDPECWSCGEAQQTRAPQRMVTYLGHVAEVPAESADVLEHALHIVTPEEWRETLPRPSRRPMAQLAAPAPERTLRMTGACALALVAAATGVLGTWYGALSFGGWPAALCFGAAAALVAVPWTIGVCAAVAWAWRGER